MAIKFLYYFIFIFIGITVFLLVQKPYSIETNKNIGKIPSIVMKTVKNYDITNEGVLSVVSADEVRRYAKYDEFDNVNLINQNKLGHVNDVSTDKGTLKNKDLKLYENVRYYRSDGLSLKSEEVFYNLNTKVLKSNVKFILANESGKTYGDSFVYDMKNDIINADNIRAIIKEKE